MPEQLDPCVEGAVKIFQLLGFNPHNIIVSSIDVEGALLSFDEVTRDENGRIVRDEDVITRHRRFRITTEEITS